MKRMPLLRGTFARSGMNIARHPWVDDIVDIIEARLTHEKRCPDGIF